MIAKMHLYFIIFLLLCLFVTSCMHVKSLEGDIATGTTEISLNLNRMTNNGGNLAENFTSVIESDDYYIAVGSSRSDLSGITGATACEGDWDFVIAKFNKSDLSIVSMNNLGGLDWDSFSDLIVSNNYYIAVGYSESDLSTLTGGTNTAGNNDFVIARFNKSDLSLDKINNFGGTNHDYFSKIIDSDSYYIAVGKSYSGLGGLTGGSGNQGSTDFVIAKINKADLSLDRVNNIGDSDIDGFESVIESDNYYIAVGCSQSDLSGFTGGSDTAGFIDAVIAKFNKADLSLVNLNNLGGTSWDYFYSIIESGDYYIVTGSSYSNLSGFTGGTNKVGFYDFVIARFNKSDISLLDLNNFGGTGDDYFYSIIESGNYYITVGYSDSDLSALTGGTNSAGSKDFAIARLNKSDLSLVEINNFGEASYDYLYSVIESDNHYIAVGSSGSDFSSVNGGANNQGLDDFVIVKIGN